jgi:hypothetical protein
MIDSKIVKNKYCSTDAPTRGSKIQNFVEVDELSLKNDKRRDFDHHYHHYHLIDDHPTAK